MNKAEFEKYLRSEGYVVDKHTSMPTILVTNAFVIPQLTDDIKQKAHDKQYESSFSIKVSTIFSNSVGKKADAKEKYTDLDTEEQYEEKQEEYAISHDDSDKYSASGEIEGEENDSLINEDPISDFFNMNFDEDY